MTQTTNRFFDEVARLMNDAAGVAQGLRREVDTLFKTQAEKWLRELDLVKREEFEAVKEMASMARDENEALKPNWRNWRRGSRAASPACRLQGNRRNDEQFITHQAAKASCRARRRSCPRYGFLIIGI